MPVRCTQRKSAYGGAGLWAVAALVLSCSSPTERTVDTPVADVAVSPPASTIAVGMELPLQAVVHDVSGQVMSGASVVWSVRDPEIASISQTGVVTARAIGSTQVAASSRGKSGIATITVQRTPVASVTVRPNRVDAAPGGRVQLTGIAYDAGQNALTDRAIIWTSSNEAVAAVSISGMVTAVAPGSATITGTSEGKSDVATVTVTQAAVATVAVTPNPLSMSVGQTTQLSAVARDGDGTVLTGRPVVWSSSNTSVATIAADGVVTAVSAGTTTITATSEGKSGTAALTVSNFAVGSVTVQPQSVTVQAKASTVLSAIVRDVLGAVVTDRVVGWSSSNPTVATVSGSGLVTGVAAGVVTITATSEGKSGSATVTVIPSAVGNVVVQPSTVSVVVGQTTPLAAVVTDVTGAQVTDRAVSWVSSNSGIATVSGTGVVTALALGSVTITATVEGKSGTATVVGAAVPVATVAVTPASTSITPGQSAPLAAVVKDANGALLTDRAVAWTSSNTAVATVSGTGVVTGAAPGTATITATSEGKSGTASVTVALVPVATVTVSPASVSLNPGQSTTLAAQLKDAGGTVLTGRTVTWSSSSTATATVTQSGVVTAVAVGTTTITASSEGKTGTATVTVALVPVASVTVSPATATVTAGQTTPLIAIAKDANGNTLTGRPVAWTSGSTGTATVSTSGVVTGVAPGTAVITATSEGRSGTATVTVTAVPVGSVTVSPSTATVTAGQTTPLSAAVKDANGADLTGRTVTWSTSNGAIATVSAGVVTGVAPGTATITATSEGKSGTATVTVTAAPVATVTVQPATASVVAGQTTTLGATAKDANGTVLTGRAVTWSSSNGAIATVSAGVVTGVAPGTATITATSEGKSGTATVTVTSVPVGSVTVQPATASVAALFTVPLSAVVKDGSGAVLTDRAVSWSSSNPLVATVSQSGVVTGVLPGSVTITATSEGKSGSASVTVTLTPVASVSITPASATVIAGQTATLIVSTKDVLGGTLTGRSVSWTSSNSTVATVSDGVVTAVSPGTATITATSEGKSGTSAITVIPVPVANVAVAPSATNVVSGQTTTLVATVTDADGGVLNRTVTWTSSAPSVASVSSTGVVTGLLVGSATITASSGGKSGTASITVTVGPLATVRVTPASATISLAVAPATLQLSAQGFDAQNNPISGLTFTWTSTDQTIVGIGSDAVARAHREGTATITATSGDKSGTAAITVTK